MFRSVGFTIHIRFDGKSATKAQHIKIKIDFINNVSIRVLPDAQPINVTTSEAKMVTQMILLIKIKILTSLVKLNLEMNLAT